MSQKPTEIFISKNLNKKKIVIKFPMQVIGDYLQADIPYNYDNISKPLVYECFFLSTVQ